MTGAPPAPAALHERYRRYLAKHQCQSDPQQLKIVHHLQRLADDLDDDDGVFRRWRARIAGRRDAPPRGLYLWGGVGGGKTFLMDLFFDALPHARKQRIHFYRFMRQVHALLQDEHRRNPLEAVAARLARRARVLCLDEFFVSDITDAMILHHLLRALFAANVVLVTTSNTAPRELYRDGLQRERFVPAIELLEKHTQVVHLDARTDYRLRTLEAGEVYHHPCDDDADEALKRAYAAIAADGDGDDHIEINGRDLAVVRQSHGVVWFTFGAVCEGPRAPADYIEIAHLHHTVLISGVPSFARRDDAARRFIQLVDELYDRNVKLIVSAAAAPGDLYRAGRLAREFERTTSRLIEMQSRRYLARAHRG